MFRLIINADDFGLSESVNYAIAEAFNKGYITNTTLMVNMPYADQAVALAKKEGFWDRVGIHLNVYEGKPMNSNLLSFQYLLCDDNRELTYWTRGRRRFLISKTLSRELYTEFEMQLQKFISYNPICMHADSHGHAHTNWPIWKQCLPLFKKYGITSTRMSRNLYVPHHSGAKELYKAFFNKNVAANDIYAAEYFGSFADMKMVLECCPEMISEGMVELMCHPNYDKDGMLVNNISIGFEELIPLLSDANWEKY